MRKTLIVALASAALVASPLAIAATPVVAAIRVDGDDFGPSGLTLVEHGCADTRALPFYPARFVAYRGPKKPPLGALSSGWVPAGTTYGVGVTVSIANPSTLKTFQIRIFSPSSAAQGVAVATYHAPGDEGVWKGLAALAADTVRGWHLVNAASLEFSWLHFTSDTSDTSDRDDAVNTISTMVSRHGGDGGGAELGLLFGCDGKSFYVDDFEVQTGRQHKVFDLGGYQTTTTTFTDSKERKNLTVLYGQRVNVMAKLRTVATGKPLVGNLKVDTRLRSGGKWSTFAKLKAASSGNSSFKVRPTIARDYRASYAGASKYDRSTSPILKIFVRKLVRAKLLDATVTKGHSFKVVGQVFPRRRTSLRLQRYIHGGWKTMKPGRTDRQGQFGISMTTRLLGKSYWRILAPSGDGTDANDSENLRLKTVAPPHSTGGGGGNDPAPPPDDPPPPPPPPPPPGPQRGWAG